MKGDIANFPCKENGLIIHSLKSLFDSSKIPKGYHCRIKVSYFEIYNEKVKDLLVKSDKPLEVRKHKGQFMVQGLIEKEIYNLNEAINAYRQGEENRSYSSTKMNDKSSRSHVIFKINIESRSSARPMEQYFSNLMLVDLAGSESIKHT